MTTNLRPQYGRPKGAYPGAGNPYPEVDPDKLDVSILGALDDMQWAKRINISPTLSQEELMLEVARTAAKVQEIRAKMLVERVRLIELTLYSVIRVGLAKRLVAKAAGMRTQALDRWLTSYRQRR